MAQIGPVLPPGWNPKGEGDDDLPAPPAVEHDDNEPTGGEDCYGPALPPDMIQESSTARQESHEEPDDDATFGPMPESTSESSDAYHYRLYKLRRDKEEEEDIRQRKRAREEWMTELPSKLSKSYGLTARTFRKHDYGSGGDSSAWTETPEERQRNRNKVGDDKTKDEKVLFRKAAADRDRKFDAEVEQLDAKRTKESLVELHTKKRKRDQEEAEKAGKRERQPFDREKELKIVKLQSSSDRRSTLDKVHQLGTRFGHGSDQKYL